MEEVSITVDKAAIGEESSLYAVGNKRGAIPDSSSGRYSNSNGFLNQKPLSDEELVRSFVESQNEEAFNELVNRYADKIYRLALRITRNPSDAEDVLQEVFITLIEKLDSFHEKSKFSTWLHRVAANASFMHLRTEKKKRKYTLTSGKEQVNLRAKPRGFYSINGYFANPRPNCCCNGNTGGMSNIATS